MVDLLCGDALVSVGIVALSHACLVFGCLTICEMVCY